MRILSLLEASNARVSTSAASGKHWGSKAIYLSASWTTQNSLLKLCWVVASSSCIIVRLKSGHEALQCNSQTVSVWYCLQFDPSAVWAFISQMLLEIDVDYEGQSTVNSVSLQELSFWAKRGSAWQNWLLSFDQEFKVTTSHVNLEGHVIRRFVSMQEGHCWSQKSEQVVRPIQPVVKTKEEFLIWQ